jgi:hypothetical protein
MRSALGLLVTGLLALALGVLGVVAFENVAVTSSQTAADEANSNDLGVPTGYGAR